MKKVHISNREKEILDLISCGFTSREMAMKLFISCDTIKTHRKNLLTKLDAPNMPNLVRRSYELGLLTIN